VKDEEVLLNGRSGFLVAARENVVQDIVPMLVLCQSLAGGGDLRPSFEPLLDGLSNCGLVAQPASALLFLEAPIEFSGERNRRFLEFSCGGAFL